MLINKIYNLCKEIWGREPEAVEKLPGAGSSRIYFRVFMPESLIATYGEDVVENRTFCRLTNVLRDTLGSKVVLPEVYGLSEDGHLYIQKDLGSESLYDLILKSRKDVALDISLEAIIRKSIVSLVNLQTVDIEILHSVVGFSEFSEQLAGWDLNYFKYCFLKPAGISFDESALEIDFEKFKKRVANYDSRLRGFMYRDFQSRNIMLVTSGDELRPGFIDYQGGRIGPMVYDIVSFLWQSRAGFTSEFRREMSEFYAYLLKDACGVPPETVLAEIKKFKLLRTLQVLGAYGFRGLIEKKTQFVESIPAAVENLAECMAENSLDDYPELKFCCEAIIADERWKKKQLSGLRVDVYSFSYKRGYPEDLSGNGGGYMFDCRGMHNPGRYPEYKTKTGRDKEVIDFLEERGEVFDFLKGAYIMIDHSVETYLRRGFNNLQIGFGCTGGQHRSVYCAEHAAQHIAQKFPDAIVKVNHREQGIRYELGNSK